jgi:hypothetical protein
VAGLLLEAFGFEESSVPPFRIVTFPWNTTFPYIVNVTPLRTTMSL